MNPDFIIALIVAAGVVAFIIWFIKTICTNRNSFVDILCFHDRFVLITAVNHSGGESESFTTWHLKCISLTTGKKLFRSKTIYQSPEFTCIIDGIVWISYATHFTAIDPYTFKTVIDKNYIYQLSPELANNDFSEIRFHKELEQISFTSAAGYPYLFDCKTGEVSKGSIKATKNSTPDVINPFTLRKKTNSEHYQVVYKNAVVYNGDAFLNSEVITFNETYCAILHFATLDKKYEAIFSLLDEHGTILWSLTHKEANISGFSGARFGQFIDRVLLIVLEADPDQMLLMRPENGKIQWKEKI